MLEGEGVKLHEKGTIVCIGTNPLRSPCLSSPLINPNPSQSKTSLTLPIPQTEGPQFSTRAESRLYRSAFAADIINMSATPECKLFREAEIAYALLCMSTDYDCWHEANEAVTVEMVMGNMGANARNAKRAVEAVLGELSREDQGYEKVREGHGWRGMSGGSTGITKVEGRDREAVKKLEWLFPGE